MLKRILAASMALLAVAVPFACSGTAGSSGRNQTCGSTGECKGGLVCKANVCVQNDFPVDTLDKVCTVVQCDTNEDCCTDFRPGPNCEEYQELCDQQTSGEGGELGFDYCEILAQLDCTCELTCEDQLCRAPQTTCEDDTGCPSPALPVCDTASGVCVGCIEDDDCDAEDGEKCIENVCQPPCVVNEECPLFNECQEGLCVEVGCKENRDCILAEGRADSECREVEGSDLKQCRTPCEVNSDCPRNLEVCQEGTCVFLGCENDEQCRGYLGLQNLNTTWRAKCVDPADATPLPGGDGDLGGL